MRILLTNDDGVHAPGLAALERIAAALSEDLWVVAPAEEQSGAGHSLTLTRPIRLARLGERRFAVAGTPTDAVMMALGHVMRECRPDLILSGVNRGPNMAEDVTYSGTVSAAMEGTLAGVRSIALSQAMANYVVGEEDFKPAEALAADVIVRLLAADWGANVLMNLNFPPDEARGVRVTEQGFRDYGNIRIEERVDPRGFRYFWFGYGREQSTPAHRTDLEAVRDGFVSVTPLHLDLTHRPSLKGLAERLEGHELGPVGRAA